MEPELNNKQLFLLGARHSIPICLGYISVGTAYAVMAMQSGYTQFQTILMSVFSYSGSGQFFAVAMAKEHSSLLALTFGMILLNFRYVIMSTCIFARFKGMSNLRRLVLAHFVTDEPFAIFLTAKKSLVSLAYFLGLVLPSWICWISGALLGVVASDFLPYNLINSMNIALYALFIAIIVPPSVKNRTLMMIVFLSALLNVVLCSFMDLCWAILITILLGSLIGAFFTQDKPQDENLVADDGGKPQSTHIKDNF